MILTSHLPSLPTVHGAETLAWCNHSTAPYDKRSPYLIKHTFLPPPHQIPHKTKTPHSHTYTLPIHYQTLSNKTLQKPNKMTTPTTTNPHQFPRSPLPQAQPAQPQHLPGTAPPPPTPASQADPDQSGIPAPRPRTDMGGGRRRSLSATTRPTTHFPRGDGAATTDDIEREEEERRKKGGGGGWGAGVPGQVGYVQDASASGCGYGDGYGGYWGGGGGQSEGQEGEGFLGRLGRWVDGINDKIVEVGGKKDSTK
ncbi:hypothetical protein L873DRAFT_1491855 [Choiromyces venosus 120613-1]|uniref:Uncharacterized protein n=1 Tax=Choiromyces venosus 120613-1 TaxID=1336337 RepID=A0A3N4J988_9PEZI|nr:hypothetical protein L873DRAFT_1491855 [Choiromyces venosus 120613-1]